MRTQDGEPESPIIALNTFLKQRGHLRGCDANVVLIEEDPRRLERLQQEVRVTLNEAAPIPPALKVHQERGDHVNLLVPILEELGAMHAPVFTFLDSFGGPDVPLETARAIAAAPAGEVLVTFGTSYLIRFENVEDHREQGDKVFGNTAWQDVNDLPSDQKKPFLVDSYRQSLNSAGFTDVISSEMLDDAGHDLHLVFGTKGRRGLEVMKDVMWKIDPAQGVRFRDPRDPDQIGFDFALGPDFGLLRKALLGQVADGECTLAQLRDYALFETVYRPQHVGTLVRQLLKDGHLQRASSGQLRGDSVLQLPARPAQQQGTLF